MKSLIEKKIPSTRRELQHAVNLAEFYLKIHSAILYGLMKGPEVNAEECEKMLELGKSQGILPDPAYMDPELPVEINVEGIGVRVVPMRFAEKLHRWRFIREELDKIIPVYRGPVWKREKILVK